MPPRAPALAAVLVLAALAGCLAPAQGPAPDAAAERSGPPLAVPRVDLGHDHADPALHPERAQGLRVLAAVPYAPPGAQGLPLFAGGQAGGRMVLAGDLLLVTLVRGDLRAGIAVLDASEAAAPRVLGHYRSDYGASEGEGLAATPDGRWAFVAIETLYSNPPVAPAIEVVDLRDPAAPRLAARVPMAAQPHVLAYVDDGGAGYVLASDYEPSLAAAGLAPAAGALSVGVTVLRFDPAAGLLAPAGRILIPPTEPTKGTPFTHDPVVVAHPATGERLLYLAAFGAGGRIYRLADPAAPELLSVTLEQGTAPVLRHHSYAPGPALVEGVLPTAAIPRSRADDGAAYLTLYDTADPAQPRWLGEWRHPDPDLLPGDEPPLNLHVPTFTANGERLLVPHFHAGLFVFPADGAAALADPQPVAHWSPPAGDAPEGAAVVSVVVMALAKDGTVLATEAVSGTLYVLALDA